jgi:hypothetical protein
MLTSQDRASGRRCLHLPVAFAGLGLVACIAACSLPLILGALGLAGGIGATAGVLEPISLGLLVVGFGAAAIAYARGRRPRKVM